MPDIKADAEPCTLVIFGASGDLTERKLIPALHSLACEGLLPDNLQILGTGRTEYTDQAFRKHLREGTAEHGRLKPGLWEDFAARLSYLPGSYDDPETFRRLEERLSKLDTEKGTGGNRLYYLAIPPVLYPQVIKQLGESGLNHSESGWTRIIIEKPFGRDLESACQLNDQVHACFEERQVYRIDHYLGKETVQNIMAFRFANFLFQEVWNRNFVDHVQITAIEQVGVAHRAGYYDKAGVVRDMVQNHLLQLLALTAMEPPVSLNATALRNEKVKVLQAIEPINLKDGVWGQYEGYCEASGVDPDSRTPTFAALELYVNNWRWQGVPFYLRTGKNLNRKVTEITLQLKEVPHLIFPENMHFMSNHLSLCLQPDEGMHLRFELKMPGERMKTFPVEMDFHYQDRFGEQALPDAYEYLLLDAMQGDASLFARADEIERAWELVTPVLEAWESMADPPLVYYEPGAEQIAAVDDLIGRNGRSWSICCVHPPHEEAT
jgi:glucose-6-phosphate 1-dehydrogenase